jgi:hypothetical protein
VIHKKPPHPESWFSIWDCEGYYSRSHAGNIASPCSPARLQMQSVCQWSRAGGLSLRSEVSDFDEWVPGIHLGVKGDDREGGK